MDSKNMELCEEFGSTVRKLKVDDDSSPDGGDGDIDEDNEILGGEDYDWEENEGEEGYYWEENEGEEDDEPFSSTGLTCREYINSMGSNVKGESIVRVIKTGVMGIKCYITFMARETPDGDVVEYQAKTEKRVWQKNLMSVIFCRPSPEPKEPPPDGECGCTDSSSEEEDSDASSRFSDQEWDYDSFDEEYDYKPPRFNTPPVKKMQLFRPLMRKSKGFDVDGECYPGSMRYFLPVNLDEMLKPYQITGREYMEEMAKLAVDKYNEMKQSNVLTFHSIVRANLTVVNGFKSYITFMAQEVPDEDPVEYQARTEEMCNQRKPHAIFCRRSPKSNGEIC